MSEVLGSGGGPNMPSHGLGTVSNSHFGPGNNQASAV